MITSVHLENFKCFADQPLSMGPLTVLTGLNGMGKSSVVQALLLLRQSYQQGLLPDKGLALNGDLLQLGTSTDVLYEGAQKEEIGIGLRCDDQFCAEWRFRYDQEADVMDLVSPVDPTAYKQCLFTNDFHYLQAERVGPRSVFEKSDYVVRQLKQLGKRGEYTVHFLMKWGRSDIPRPQMAYPSQQTLRLLDQAEAWLSEISPGTRIHTEDHQGTDLISVLYSFEAKPYTSNNYRSTNVGFGITYCLPVLVALLASPAGSLVVIENPEAHLHPRGQSLLGRLVSMAASGGVQVIVETHSDHVLNGIRVAVRDGLLHAASASVHFFTRQTTEAGLCAKVVSPRIDSNGRFDRWPEGFFDEWDRNLEALMRPRGVADEP